MHLRNPFVSGPFFFETIKRRAPFFRRPCPCVWGAEIKTEIVIQIRRRLSSHEVPTKYISCGFFSFSLARPELSCKSRNLITYHLVYRWKCLSPVVMWSFACTAYTYNRINPINNILLATNQVTSRMYIVIRNCYVNINILKMLNSKKWKHILWVPLNCKCSCRLFVPTNYYRVLISVNNFAIRIKYNVGRVVKGKIFKTYFAISNSVNFCVCSSLIITKIKNK